MRLNHITSSILALSASLNLFAASSTAKYLKNPDHWFTTDEAAKIAMNIISYQSLSGGFPKNINTTSKPYTGDRKDIKPTFDNGATVDELRFLARYYRTTKNAAAKDSFLKGFDYIIGAQYENGGFPQSYPPGNGYHKYITFNDSTMVRLLEFLKEITESKIYDFIDDSRKLKAKSAFERGIDCILKCQIKVNGELTVWCAQHDEKTLEPRGARTFELPSLSGAESAGIVRLLMKIKNPSTNIILSVRSAVKWFKTVSIKGIKIVAVKDDKSPTGKDRGVVRDPAAPPIWARFYEIGTNKPIFADRDGVKKYSLSEIGYERRNGYAWYGYWAQELIEKEYPEWEKEIGSKQ
ncbi:MAG: pectate lyase [Verrucomicrobiia bacterium]